MKITIFGLAGTGTSTVGKLLANRLSFKYLSTGDIMREMAKNAGLTLLDFQSLAKSDPKYDREIDGQIEKFGRDNDNFVIESRLAWHFIPDSLKIKLYADFSVRVQRVAARDSLSIEDSGKHIEKREKIDKERYLIFYGINNISENKNFDLVIDSSVLTPEEIVNTIIKSPHLKATP